MRAIIRLRNIIRRVFQHGEGVAVKNRVGRIFQFFALHKLVSRCALFLIFLFFTGGPAMHAVVTEPVPTISTQPLRLLDQLRQENHVEAKSPDESSGHAESLRKRGPNQSFSKKLNGT